MALLERVATLLRASVNDVLDKAENPPAMFKQLLLDMENQLMQVKTQVAIAIADEHVLQAKRGEYENSVASWRRKAELALAKNNEALARAAVERSVQAEQLLAGYSRQLAEQQVESELLRQQYRQLEAKLAETTSEGELLLSSYRRNTRGSAPAKPDEAQRVLGRMRDKALTVEAGKAAQGRIALELGAPLVDQLRQLEQDDKVEAVLAELRRRPNLLEG